MTDPSKLNPIICDSLADTAHLAYCASKFLAVVAEHSAGYKQAAEACVVCSFDELSSEEARGHEATLRCITAALDYAIAQMSVKGGAA